VSDPVRRPADPARARFRHVQQAFELAESTQAIARRLAPAGPPHPRNTGWMPFNLYDFNGLLGESVKLIPDGGYFLDVGCGNGPDMIIARDVYGMDAYGFDVNEALIADAVANGLHAEVTDALSYAGYGKADCIWLNRPLRDRETEAGLEQLIWREMKPGAVIICANLENPPPESWIIINDSWDDLRRGAWVKPYTAPDPA
jgi:SAM-dependent methyltransferase